MLPTHLHTVVEIQRERCQALLQEAQTAQLIAQVQHSQPAFWASSLAYLCDWLIVCGYWLKRHHKSASVTQFGSR